MSVYEPNSRHFREVLIFCFNMKKSAAEAHRMLSNIYGEAAISERTCHEWFQRFKNGDFDVEDIAVEERRFSKVQNWRHYLSKTRVKIKKNWHDHWEWLNKPFQNASKPWEWFRSKEIGYELVRIGTKPYELVRSREMLNGVCLLVNSCLKGKDGRDFCIVTWDEKWVHYDNPKHRKSWGVPGHASRRRPNRIFTAPRSCSVFGGTSSA